MYQHSKAKQRIKPKGQFRAAEVGHRKLMGLGEKETRTEAGSVVSEDKRRSLMNMGCQFQIRKQ